MLVRQLINNLNGMLDKNYWFRLKKTECETVILKKYNS